MVAENIDPLLESLARVVRLHRRAAGLSQEELAHNIGRSMRYISLIESRRHQPSLDTLKRLSDGLELTLSQLIIEVEEDAKQHALTKGN
ncbi:helix-turn-helix domain-containing protein [Falsihalocynthiibacter arcticus]|uniref:HTH cro/C1-type domain-containing protein n=1 Tax=Falsihalocynthiibacter arcticus TaxID=1579316 RepID=A0A126V3X0_9RHOB|nr:helix-turn-helix transcriptional regulator [Falsihalocynthiibacter arcticus]AML52566.1 hypothetical protein RC74_15970 [Falsihalocynthiibacter arcticus]